MIFSLTYHKIKNVGSGSSPGNDFRLFFFFLFSSPYCFGCGVPVGRELYFLSVYWGTAMWKASRSQRSIGLGEGRLSCGCKWLTLSTIWQLWRKGLESSLGKGSSLPAGLPLNLPQKWRKPSQGLCQRPGALREAGYPVNGDTQRQDKQSPCKVQMGPTPAFLLANGRVCPGFYGFLGLGLWEKKLK